MKIVTTFPGRREYETVQQGLDRFSLPYQAVLPEPGCGLVGSPALVVEEETRVALADGGVTDFVCSGWVEHREPETDVPGSEPKMFGHDAFGRAVIMVLAPCVADPTKIRLIAHLSGDLAETFAYLNAEMREAWRIDERRPAVAKKLQVLGTGCAKCKKLAENTEAAAKDLGIEYELEKVTQINEITKFGVMMTPALAVDGEVKVVGKVPSVDDIKGMIS